MQGSLDLLIERWKADPHGTDGTVQALHSMGYRVATRPPPGAESPFFVGLNMLNIFDKVSAFPSY